MAKKSASMSTKAEIGIGVGVTAALLSAAGAYFLYGSKDGAKNRKKVKSWALKAKAEVLEGIEKAKDMTKEEYEQLIDSSAQAYSKLKGASASEIVGFAREMKAHWKNLEKKGEKMVVKAIKKAMPKKPASKKILRPVGKKMVKTAKKV